QLKVGSELLRRSAEAAQWDDNRESSAVHLAHIALMEAHIGHSQEVSADAERALRLAKDFYGEGASALALARVGNIARARKLATDLNNRFSKHMMVQRIWLPTIRAAIALDSHHPKEAIEALKATSPYDMSLGVETPADPVYLRGQAYLMLRDSTAAAEEFQK